MKAWFSTALAEFHNALVLRHGTTHVLSAAEGSECV